MAFRIEEAEGQAGDQVGPIIRMVADDGSCLAEVWPFMGFNCLRWQALDSQGRLGNLLFQAPDWHENPVPTRSGHPILFPFPNRIRDGEFSFNGKSYRLPKNDSSQQNAIHGFAPRNAWRVINSEAEADFASVTGQFRHKQDVPATESLWPGDGCLTLTYKLEPHALSVLAVVDNFGDEPFPFGLGYHPYFQLPGVDHPVDDWTLGYTAQQEWVVSEGLPTGVMRNILPEFDFRTAKRIGNLPLDHLFGGLEPMPTGRNLGRFATLEYENASGKLEFAGTSEFRELVLFVPPHRRAIAIEPYSCATDAINLEAKGIDAGWRTLAPGDRWSAQVQYTWMPH